MIRRRQAALAACAALLPLLVWLPTQAAPPQTVYRCGPDGRVYSQTPCADGKSLAVDDPRSPQQQKAARDVATRDAEQANKLADERRRREDAAKGQAAAGFKTGPQAEAASAPARKPKSKAKVDAKAADPSMSPLMVAPAPAPAKR
jgi:hypothetical protein